MIDLRSDTVTRPTEAMRAAIAFAPVGDDVYGDDPTVGLLEETVAALLGMDAAVYMPSGTMTNQLAVRAHTEPGDAVFVGPDAHIWLGEAGAPSPISGVVVRPLAGDRGVFTADALREASPSFDGYTPRSLSAPARLVCLENTHNGAGGSLWPLDGQREVLGAAQDLGLAAHLDGARLWHACAATGISEADYARGFDTVSVCFSKGLGAPIGSVLAGSADLITRARRFKQLYGGGFRQAGMMAAGALHALEHHRERLTEDHRRARELAEPLAEMPGVELDLEGVVTNIVRFRSTAMPAPELVQRCRERALALLSYNDRDLRAVTHLDFTDGELDQAITIFREVLTG
ncbi:MAG: beta-eliminating lyase-related protein [Gemmatimonadota bacterium]|nr:beta-eliminating lyase-related protein [Gemmatimonadota bacterium]